MTMTIADVKIMFWKIGLLDWRRKRKEELEERARKRRAAEEEDRKRRFEVPHELP